MLKSTKVILITAGVLIGLGLIISGIALGINKARYGSLGFANEAQDSGKYERLSTTIDDDFEDVEIAEVSSSVNVMPTDQKKAYVEYTNGESFEHVIKVSGNTLKIEYKEKGGWYNRVGFFTWFMGRPDMSDESVNVYLPAAEYGNVYIACVSGEISVDDIKSSRTDINSVSGSIKITDSDLGNLNVNSTSGEIELSSCEVTSADIDSISGNVKLDTFKSHDTDISTTSGEVSLKDCECGETDIETVSGDVKGNLIGEYEIDYDTVSGDVDINGSIPGGYKIEVDTTSGNIKLDQQK
ncbi:MAG: DUF4097 domain-containing protein [Lachnospiraceae bacterium]|nr:DUF4097 domain-containing protein [Lachnospiraceae bacterium]